MKILYSTDPILSHLQAQIEKKRQKLLSPKLLYKDRKKILQLVQHLEQKKLVRKATLIQQEIP